MFYTRRIKESHILSQPKSTQRTQWVCDQRWFGERIYSRQATQRLSKAFRCQARTETKTGKQQSVNEVTNP